MLNVLVESEEENCLWSEEQHARMTVRFWKGYIKKNIESTVDEKHVPKHNKADYINVI